MAQFVLELRILQVVGDYRHGPPYSTLKKKPHMINI
jgi:hypothetical protein